jgi:hypothetical protein
MNGVQHNILFGARLNGQDLAVGPVASSCSRAELFTISFPHFIFSKSTPNLAKSSKARAKEIKEKSFDFLGFSWRK